MRDIIIKPEIKYVLDRRLQSIQYKPMLAFYYLESERIVIDYMIEMSIENKQLHKTIYAMNVGKYLDAMLLRAEKQNYLGIILIFEVNDNLNPFNPSLLLKKYMEQIPFNKTNHKFKVGLYKQNKLFLNENWLED